MRIDESMVPPAKPYTDAELDDLYKIMQEAEPEKEPEYRDCICGGWGYDKETGRTCVKCGGAGRLPL